MCTRCGEEICAGCHGTDLRGLAVCTRCRGGMPVVEIPFEAEEPGPTFAGFRQTLSQAIFSPQMFFAGMPTQGVGWAPAAVFGTVCVALGLLANGLWEKAVGADYAEDIARNAEALGMTAGATEAALFLMIPLGAVITYFLHTALLYCSLRIFGVSTSWGVVARISGYALSGYVLMVAPPLGSFSLGHFLMIFWVFNLEVSAMRWLYGLGFWKSMGVVLLPLMLFIMATG